MAHAKDLYRLPLGPEVPGRGPLGLLVELLPSRKVREEALGERGRTREGPNLEPAQPQFNTLTSFKATLVGEELVAGNHFHLRENHSPAQCFHDDVGPGRRRPFLKWPSTPRPF